MHGRFSDPYCKVLGEEVKTIFFQFFFIGASATKDFERSRNFRYGLTKDILSKGQKTGGGEHPAHGRLGLITFDH